jgi:hypothetical protein
MHAIVQTSLMICVALAPRLLPKIVCKGAVQGDKGRTFIDDPTVVRD